MQITKITKIANPSIEAGTAAQANIADELALSADKLVALSFTVAEMQNAQASQEAKLNLAMLNSVISLITSVAALALAIM